MVRSINLENLHRKQSGEALSRQASKRNDLIIFFSVNHPSRTLAALQTPRLRVLNLPLTSQALTRVSGSSRRCHNRAASCLLAGGRGKQKTKTLSGQWLVKKEPERWFFFSLCVEWREGVLHHKYHLLSKKKTALSCNRPLEFEGVC